MNLNLRRSLPKQGVRAATALAGAAVLSVGVATGAQANTAPPQPYKIWVRGTGSDFIQVCGYKDISGVGHWRCTAKQVNTGNINYMGSDWLRGKINVWLSDSYPDSNVNVLHTCNTNGAYYGHLQEGGVVLTHQGGSQLGTSGHDPC